jgi:hypothetical protein
VAALPHRHHWTSLYAATSAGSRTAAFAIPEQARLGVASRWATSSISAPVFRPMGPP